MMRTPMIAVLAIGTILTISGGLPGPAWAQDATARPPAQDVSVKPIGKVVTAKGEITIEHVNAVVVQANLGNPAGGAKVGDPVYNRDVVRTGPDGEVGIAFADGTAFNLSKNARIELNEFIYDPNGTSNSSLMTLGKGTFTFIAGRIATTGNMTVDTPAATMGIRGTTPHVEISDDGTVKFSTLVETGKNEILEKYGAATVKPRDNGASPDTPREEKKLNLQICKGC